MKIVVYTAIIGGYDKPLKHKALDGVDYKLIQDVPIDIDNVRKARYTKTHPHLLFPDYDYSIWIDGNMQVVGDIRQLIKSTEKSNIAVLRMRGDPKERCVSDEARVCAKLGKDKKDILDIQINKYFDQGYDKKDCVYETGLMIRKHNDPTIVKAMEAWWNEIKAHSIRDQISFSYAMWKHNIDFSMMDNLNTSEMKKFIKFGIKHG